MAYVNCESYNFGTSPHETLQIKLHNQKCSKTQIWPYSEWPY